jgi:hypothetical protein
VQSPHKGDNMKKFLSASHGLNQYKDSEFYWVEDEQGNVLKKAKSGQTISNFVQKIAEEKLAEEKRRGK